MQWIYPAISAPEAQSWEDGGFKANLGYTVTLSPEDTGKKKVKNVLQDMSFLPRCGVFQV